MHSQVLKIGDIVSLKSHPYINKITTIIISGEPLLSPPLMVIIEKITLKSADKTNLNDVSNYEYVCAYFSNKLHTFEKIKVKGIHLKLIIESNTESSISREEVFPGVMVTLKSMDYELAKKKSSFTFEDTSLNNGSDNTTITALLTYLPPTLHVISLKEHQTKHPTHNNEEVIRLVPSWDVKCFWYNSHKEKMSEEIFPLESLKIVVSADEGTIEKITDFISKSSAIEITHLNESYLIKPRIINYRSGYYFLRGYDFVLNRITEHKIAYPTIFTEAETHIIKKVPSFDIKTNPAAATKDFIISEIKTAIGNAEGNKNYIRIQYRSRNEIVTLRTLKNYKYVEVDEEEKKYGYVIGFCCLRMAERAFRTDRIQQVEELNFKYTK
ncbi:hypothetical protein HDE69_002014 [Pedobacter cryoconitis]|uniref:WYL domain-containing protein n=1 Tax=Pedobacter cryoconitis TaxID=188932 RepID=A0A7W9DJ97_9SPHI|nr:WYL domain-containing protein [Pedobacter cryoconitis]MBB5620961.1 hypothetical protein [Pedobacter cryoconitis]